MLGWRGLFAGLRGGETRALARAVSLLVEDGAAGGGGAAGGFAGRR